MDYTTFTSAYTPENLESVQRVSTDVPTDIQEWKQIVSSTPVIVIYLWSESCRPCHLVRDKYEKLASQLQSEDIRFYKDCIDLETSFHRQQVDVVPTFFILCDGHELRHPVHRSVYNGWVDGMPDSIMYHLSQSQLHDKKRRVESGPTIVCRNNVCYINR